MQLVRVCENALGRSQCECSLLNQVRVVGQREPTICKLVCCLEVSSSRETIDRAQDCFVCVSLLNCLAPSVSSSSSSSGEDKARAALQLCLKQKSDLQKHLHEQSEPLIELKKKRETEIDGAQSAQILLLSCSLALIRFHCSFIHSTLCIYIHSFLLRSSFIMFYSSSLFDFALAANKQEQARNVKRDLILPNTHTH